LFLSGRIGETFDAIVTGSSEKGTWVRLLQPPAEGRLFDARPGIHVGDRVRVRLTNLNVERGFIDFVRS
jgi:exoribonuclease-2